MDDDLSAIRRIQAGDERGLSFLMSRYKEAVFRFVLRYTGDEADAAELAEDTFLRVYRNAHRFRPEARVSTWIFAIASNLARDRLRRNRKRRGVVSLQAPVRDEDTATPEDRIADPGRDPSETAAGREVLDLLESTIRQLPEKLRFPFVFCVIEGHSYDSCAEVLKCSRKTVETRIYRARQQLKKRLEGSTG